MMRPCMTLSLLAMTSDRIGSSTKVPTVSSVCDNGHPWIADAIGMVDVGQCALLPVAYGEEMMARKIVLL